MGWLDFIMIRSLFDEKEGTCSRFSPSKFFVLALLVIMGTVVLFPFLTFQKVYLFKDIGSDTINAFYPQLLHTADYIREWGIPRWSFNQGLGQNIFPGGLENPFVWPLLALGRDYMAYGIAYVELLKIVLSGWIFFHYLRLLPLSRYVSAVGAVLYAFSGYMIIGTGWWLNHSGLVVSFAFLLFAFEKGFLKKSWVWFPPAIALASGPYFAFFVLFFIVYACIRYLDQTPLRRGSGTFSALIQYIAGFIQFSFRLAMWGLLGLCMNAFFLLGWIGRVLQSPRVSGGFSYADQLKNTPLFSLASKEEYLTILARWFSNDLVGCGDAFAGWRNYLEAPAFYCGLITLLLLPQIIFVRPIRRKIASLSLLLVWAPVLLFPHFRYAFYLYSGNYYKAGLSLFIPFVCIFSGCRVLDGIKRSQENGRSGLLWISFLACGAVLFGVSQFAQSSIPILITVGLFLTLHLFVFLRIVREGGSDRLWVLLFVLICLEASLFSFHSVNRREAVTGMEQAKTMAGYNDGTMEAVELVEEVDDGVYRVLKNYSSGSSIHASINDAVAQDFFGSASYHSFNQGSYVRFLTQMGLIKEGSEGQSRWVRGVRGFPHLETLLGVKYKLIKTQENLLPFETLGYKELCTVGQIRVFQNQFALPLCIAYKSCVQEKEVVDLKPFEQQRVLLNQAIVDDSLRYSESKERAWRTQSTNFSFEEYASVVSEFRKNPVACTQFSQNKMQFVSFLDESCILFFSIPYDRGWQASIEGDPVDLKRVNYGFLGLSLPKGEHVIDLEFLSPGYFQTMTVSVLACFIYALLCIRVVHSEKGFK
jgi:hypothetical protein